MMRSLAPINPRVARPVKRVSKRKRPEIRLPAIRNGRTYLGCGAVGIAVCVALSAINVISVVASATSIAAIAIVTAIIINALSPRKKETIIIKRVVSKQRVHICAHASFESD